MAENILVTFEKMVMGKKWQKRAKNGVFIHSHTILSYKIKSPKGGLFFGKNYENNQMLKFRHTLIHIHIHIHINIYNIKAFFFWFLLPYY